jgi:4-hydroxyproline epimerase
VPGLGTVSGDVAWGGNWFFLTEIPGLEPHRDRIEELTEAASAISSALERSGITGQNGAQIDHIEIFGPSDAADSRNFVLCPGKAYDRSPCGTGTSAKLACLHADGKLAPGQTWTQESVIGSTFVGSYSLDAEGHVLPVITGTAFISSVATLILDDQDPFCWGIS